MSTLGTGGGYREGTGTRPRNRNRAAGKKRDRWEERGCRPDKGAQCHLGIVVFCKTALLISYFVDEETEAQERCVV